MGRWLSYTQLSSILVLWLVGFGRSDFASDRNECTDKLFGMATCLTYVQGQAKAPTPDCCTGFKQVVAQSKKCVCVLIKDRDEPSLGFKINVTLALRLPGYCSAPFNASQCIDLLHLAPNSADAQMFKQFESTLEAKNNTAPVTSGTPSNPSTAITSGSPAVVTTNAAADGGKRWVLRNMVGGVWIWLLIMGA